MKTLLFLCHVRIHRFSITLAMTASLVAAPTCATTHALRFDEGVLLAVDHAPTIAARQFQTEAAREEAARASALPDPQLMLGVRDLPVDTADALDFGVDSFTLKTILLSSTSPQ